MIKLPNVGEVVEYPDNYGIPMTILAIALHYDILDIVVIWGKGTMSGYMVFEMDKVTGTTQNWANYADHEESGQNYVERAFGINV